MNPDKFHTRQIPYPLFHHSGPSRLIFYKKLPNYFPKMAVLFYNESFYLAPKKTSFINVVAFDHLKGCDGSHRFYSRVPDDIKYYLFSQMLFFLCTASSFRC